MQCDTYMSLVDKVQEIQNEPWSSGIKAVFTEMIREFDWARYMYDPKRNLYRGLRIKNKGAVLDVFMKKFRKSAESAYSDLFCMDSGITGKLGNSDISVRSNLCPEGVAIMVNEFVSANEERSRDIYV